MKISSPKGRRALGVPQGEQGVTAELVDVVVRTVAGQDRRCCRGVVGPGGRTHAAVAGAAEDRLVLQRRRELLGVVLEVPGVAEEHVVQAGVEDQPLGGRVFGRQQHGCGVGVGRGWRQVDTRLRGRSGAVLLDALPPRSRRSGRIDREASLRLRGSL
jgi:hypothetical protein